MLILTLFLLSSVSGMIQVSGESRGDIMGEWESLQGGGWPESITTSYCNVMYRELENELVVFNRENSEEWEVWSFFENNETWIKWTTHGPEPNATYSSGSFIADEGNNIAYFYGGYRSQGWTTYTWDKLNIFFFSNKTWIEVDVPSSLGGAYDSGITYDPATDSVWIFGGRDEDRNFKNGIFQYNLTDGWNEPEPVIKPSGRDRVLMTMDPKQNHIYISLGRYRTQGWNSYYEHDLWRFNATSETWTEISDDMGIDTDSGGILIFRPSLNDLVLSMGFDGNTQLNDTFIIDPEDGSYEQVNLTGGITRRDVIAWDLLSDGYRCIVFGDSEDRKDIWTLDLLNIQSSMRVGNLPWAGGSAFTGYDSEDGGKLMTLKRVGGSYWQLAYFSLASRTWINVEIDNTGAPSTSDGMAFAYDHVNNDFYLYGGVDIVNLGQGNYRWVHYDHFHKMDCDAGEWTLITENSLPGERGRASLAFDEERGHLYLFGGQVPLGDTNSLWQYNISSNAWKSYSFTQQPNPRREHAVEFDQELDRMFIFGGRRNGTSTAEYDDLWAYDVKAERWQKMPEGDKPTIQNNARISYNTHTKELMMMGDTDEELYLWRENWLGWIPQESKTRPEEWSGHGQVYSPENRRHYAWAHDGTQVWEYNPILRTTAQLIKLYNPKGELLNAIPPNVNKVFPTSGIYKATVTGSTDMPESDLLGFHVNISGDDNSINTTWMVSSGVTDQIGKEDFIDVLDNISIEFPEDDEWKLTIPFEVLFSGPNGGVFDLRVYPITRDALSERSQRENLFRLLSDLKVAGYQFSSPLQESVSDGGWLFGRTNLTVSGFKVTFSDDVSVSPDSGNLRVNMITSQGDSSFWDYVPGEDGEITVPVRGDDREIFTVYLNLTNLEGDLVNSQEFSFRLDLDPPTAPSWVKVRADSIIDDKHGLDDDNEVFLTWGTVIENGSGYKGMCYSIDHNDWPGEANLTIGFPDPITLIEGEHRIFVWAMDNTSRAGPFVEADLIVDTHMVVIEEVIPDPLFEYNVTQSTFTFRVNIKDELSGVDLDSIQFQQSLPDRSLSEWMDYEVTADDIRNVSFSMTIELVGGIKNIFGIRAGDLAGNPIKESPKFGVRYDPGLATPQAWDLAPEEGTSTDGRISLTWEGDYINPQNITYQIHIEDPRGTEHIYDIGVTEYDFKPAYPGIHTWWVVSKADGMTNQTDKMTFIFHTDLLGLTLNNEPSATIGNDVAVEIGVSNPLSIVLNYTISLVDAKGFTLKAEDIYTIISGAEETVIVALGSAGKEKGTYNLQLNITDEYGRSDILIVSLRLEPEEDIGPDEEEEEGGIPIALIIGIVIIVLIVVIVIVVLVMRRKKDEGGEEIEEEEEKPISLDYDPTGVVSEGGTGASVNVPMAPGTLQREEEMRKRGSNVMEISIPSKEEDPEVASGDIPPGEGMEPPAEEELPQEE